MLLITFFFLWFLFYFAVSNKKKEWNTFFIISNIIIEWLFHSILILIFFSILFYPTNVWLVYYMWGGMGKVWTRQLTPSWIKDRSWMEKRWREKMSEPWTSIITALGRKAYGKAVHIIKVGFLIIEKVTHQKMAKSANFRSISKIDPVKSNFDICILFPQIVIWFHLLSLFLIA